jgi:hypothetical protein
VYWNGKMPANRYSGVFTHVVQRLGTKQDLVHAPNDAIKLRVKV